MIEKRLQVVFDFRSGEILALVFVGVEACDVRLGPVGVFEEKRGFGIDAGLNGKVATLAKGHEVPPDAIGFVAVKVMDGKHVTAGGVVGVPTTDTTMACLLFYLVSNGRPIGWVFAACVELHFVSSEISQSTGFR